MYVGMCALYACLYTSTLRSDWENDGKESFFNWVTLKSCISTLSTKIHGVILKTIIRLAYHCQIGLVLLILRLCLTSEAIFIYWVFLEKLLFTHWVYLVKIFSSIRYFYLVIFWWIECMEAGRSVAEDVEVRCDWWTHWGRSILCIHLVVDETPLLKKCMYPETHSDLICHVSNCFPTLIFSNFPISSSNIRKHNIMANPYYG